MLGLVALLAGVGWLLPAAAPQEQFENGTYVAVVGRANGGLLASLRAKATGEELVEGMRIYTDYGVYQERGYVGTAGAGVEEFEVQREGERLTTRAAGKLVGAPAQGQPAVRYRVQMDFDGSPRLHISAGVQPEMDKEGVRGFLALCWAVPALAKWRLRTVEGLLQHFCRPGEGSAGRSYSHEWPLDLQRPLIVLASSQGAELHLSGLRWAGVPAFTGAVVHGNTLFLCWLDGIERDLRAGQWGQLEFDLEVRGG